MMRGMPFRLSCLPACCCCCCCCSVGRSPEVSVSTWFVGPPVSGHRQIPVVLMLNGSHQGKTPSSSIVSSRIRRTRGCVLLYLLCESERRPFSFGQSPSYSTSPSSIFRANRDAARMTAAGARCLGNITGCFVYSGLHKIRSPSFKKSCASCISRKLSYFPQIFF